jgi:hypothetical protein
MKRLILACTLAAIALVVVAGFSTRRIGPSAPAPEVSLGVMKSCAHLGALAGRIALDREEGIVLDQARYRYYQEYLRRRHTLFRAPDFALLLAYQSAGLTPEGIRNLGVQTCVAAYYGFREHAHRKALYQEALTCQEASSGEENARRALDDCMGTEYQGLLSQWWREANDET